MTSQWEIDVDVRRCVGSGVCAGVTPAYFVVVDGRQAQPRARVVDPDEGLLDAAFTCPMEAITIVESGSGRSIFPDEG